MNIQLVIVDPHHLEDKNRTVVMGIIQTDTLFDNYTIRTVSFSTEADSLVLDIDRIDKGETLIERADRDDDLNSLSFHHVLKKPIWKEPEDDRVAGEITLVSSSIPYQPESLHSYIFFGIVKDKEKFLSPFSSHVHQAKDAIELDEYSARARVIPIGIRAPHTTGNHLTLPLTYPIWGFNENKVGMRSTITDTENELFVTARRLIVGTSVSDDDVKKAVRINPHLKEKAYVDYLRYAEKCPSLDGFRDALWITRDQARAFKAFTLRYHERSNNNSEELTP